MVCQDTNSGLRILLIEADAEYANQLRDTLSRAPGALCELHVAEGLLPGLDCLARNEFDVVLIDTSLPDCHGLDAVEALRMHAPAVPIVVLSGVDSEALALRAVLIGAQDFLVKSKLEPDSFSRSLRYAIVRQKSKADYTRVESQGSSAQVIGCLGAKGGVGTTAIACHFGLELKRQTGHRVLLADLDMSGGALGFRTGAKSAYTILEAANDLLRLDQTLWERVVSTGPEELEILPLAGPICSEEHIRTDRIRYVIRFLRSIYPWIVLDLGRLSPLTASLLSDLTELLLVTEYEVAAVRETRQVVDRLAEMAFESRQVTLVVNKVPKMDCVAALEISKALGIPFSTIIPEGAADLSDTKSAIRPPLSRLAARVAGLEEKPSAWRYFPFLAGLNSRYRQLKTA